MSMDPSRPAKAVADYYLGLRDCWCYNGGQEILRFLEKELDAEFQRATPTYTNIDITTPADTLYFGERYFKDSTEMPWIISREVARYWGATIETTGQPVSCSSISSVSNDASKIIEPLAWDLIYAADNTIITPYYERFFRIIIDHVRTIIWTVHESDGDCDATFSVNVI